MSEDGIVQSAYCSSGAIKYKMKSTKKCVESENEVSTQDSSCTKINKDVTKGPTIISPLVIKTMALIFSPFVTFINSFSNTIQNLTNTDKKQTAKDLVDMLEDIEKEVTDNKDLDKNLSGESKAALAKLFKEVDEISKREDLKDLDISELIKKWRESESSKVLLGIADRIKQGESININDEKLKRAFVEGLESFASVLDEISKHPPSKETDQAKKIAVEGATSILDGVKKVDEKGSDSNLTNEDKRYIGEKLNFAADCACELSGNPALSGLLGSVLEKLLDWSYFIFDWFENYYQEIEEEKKQEEKLCKERKEEKKQFYELQRLAEKAKLKERYFKGLINEILTKLKNELHTKFEKDKMKGSLENAKNKYRSEASNGDYYCEKKCEILDDMPPSSVCGTYNLELDLTC